MTWLDENKWFLLAVIALGYLAWAYRYDQVYRYHLLDRWTGTVLTVGDLLADAGAGEPGGRSRAEVAESLAKPESIVRSILGMEGHAGHNLPARQFGSDAPAPLLSDEEVFARH